MKIIANEENTKIVQNEMKLIKKKYENYELK